MRTVLALVRKDFTRRWRSPVSTVVLLVFPFMMAGMIGTISSGSGGGIPELTVFVLDRDQDFFGGLLTQGPPPSSDQVALNIVEVGEEGFARMEEGEASAMIVLEPGFTQRALNGEEARFRLVRNPAESIKPEIVEQGLEVLSIYIDVVVKVLGEEIKEFDAMLDGDEMPTMLAVTELSSRVYRRLEAGSLYIFPPVVKIESSKEGSEDGGDSSGPNVFGYILVMISVMSVLFAAIRAVTEIYEDRRTGMIRRVLSTPLPPVMLVGAKMFFAVLFGVLVMGVLLVSGAILGWFDSGMPVAAVLLHTAAFSTAAAGLMVVLVSLVNTEKQAGILSWIVVMAMSVLGGSMIPVENMPAGMRSIAHFTLNYWAVEGYLDLVVRDIPATTVLRTSAGLFAAGLALLAVGIGIMRVRIREALA